MQVRFYKIRKRSVFLLLFCTRFFIRIFIFFYLYIFILEMLGKLLKSQWNSHCVVNIA